VVSFLGEGTFTWVYRARDPSRGRDAVLKVLRPDLAEGRAPGAFLREGRVLVGVQNAHLVEVYGGGEADGLHYLAFEFVRGPNLEQICSTDPLPVPRAALLGAGVLSALGSAHRKGVPHLDLRPSKVLVARGSLAKVMDFGIAGVFEESDHEVARGYLDPRYASPEHARGEPVSKAADQYAAGLLIYKMLTGKLPFQSKTPRGFLTLHASAEPRPIQELRAGIPPPLADAVHRSLAKVASDRFPSVGVFEKVVAGFIRAT
jgi:serine/threonine-protein kinase